MAYNGSGITAAPVKVSTGTIIRTMLQVATPSTTPIKIVEYGVSFDGSSAATPVEVELLQTDIAATGLQSFTPQTYDDPNAVASACVGSSSATGYNNGSGVSEGTVTTTRYGDLQLIAPTNQYVKQWPLGREFQVPVSKFLRIRVTTGVAVNCYCYIVWEE
jgi:hypothetical protein